MSVAPPKPASWSYAEAFVAEDEVLAAARARADEVGVRARSAPAAAPRCASWRPSSRPARSSRSAPAPASPGSGCCAACASDGVLTTVDIEAEHQRLARETFTEAGVAPQRARTIAGAALDVLPRLTDGHYDLVFCDGDKTEYAAYLEEALRLLRPGGVVAFDNALWHDRVADPAQRDEETVAIRDLGRRSRHESWCRCCSRRRRPAGGQEGVGRDGLTAERQVTAGRKPCRPRRSRHGTGLDQDRRAADDLRPGRRAPA